MDSDKAELSSTAPRAPAATSHGRRLNELQERAVRYCLERRRALLGLMPGVGKTAIALSFLKRARGFEQRSLPALVLSPSSNCFHWVQEAERWLGMRHRPEVYRQQQDAPQAPEGAAGTHLCWIAEGRDRFPVPGALIYVMSYQMALNLYKSGRLQEARLGTAILDESHCLQTPRSQTTLMAQAAFHAGRVPYCLCLTGTPANRTVQLWPQLALLCPEGLRAIGLTYRRFVMHYCAGKEVRRGYDRVRKKPLYALDASGSSNLQELCSALERLCLFTGGELGQGCGRLVRARAGGAPVPPPERHGEFTFERRVVIFKPSAAQADFLAELWLRDKSELPELAQQLDHADGAGGLGRTQQADPTSIMTTTSAAAAGIAVAREATNVLAEYGGLVAPTRDSGAGGDARVGVASPRATKRRKFEHAAGGARAGRPDLCRLVTFSRCYNESKRIKQQIAKRYFTEKVAPLLRDRKAQHKCLLFCDNTDFWDLLQQWLRELVWPQKADPGKYFVALNGATPQSQRAGLIQRFQQKPRCRAAVLSIRAAGKGLNLAAADHVFFFQLTWSGSDLLQAEKRACRMGQRRHVRIVILLLDTFIERRQWALNTTKIKNQAAFLDQAALASEGLQCETEYFN